MRSQLNAYLAFCTFYTIEPFPVSKSVFLAYLSFLGHSLSTYRSLLNYINILKHINHSLGETTEFMSDYDCAATLRGLRRHLKDKLRHTLPVTVDILLNILRSFDTNNVFHVCMHAAFTVAFFSFLRVSNLFPYRASDSISLDRLFLRRRDVIFYPQGCFLRIRKTKTVQFGEDLIDIPLPIINNSSLCPVRALRQYIALVPAHPSSPLFVLQDNSPILVKHFNSFFKQCIANLGLDSKYYSSRSFRKGGATFAFNRGAPTELIKAQGTWKSDAYLVYLTLSSSKQLEILTKITNHLSGVN